MPDQSLHILHAIRQTTFGGGEVYVTNLVRALRLKGINSSILTFQDGAIGEQLKDEGFEVIHYPSTSAFDVKIIKQVARLLAGRKFDIIHVHGTRAASNVLLPAKWAKIPSIYTVHGWSFHPGLMGLKRFARKQIEGWICKLATKVVCTGQQDAIIGIREISISAPTVITNGIPLDVFTAVPPLSIIRGQMTFGFVGRLTYQKYPELLAEAFKQISGQYPNAKLVIVGGGELEPTITKILSAEIEHGQVEMRPFTKDVAGQLATLDALILPSRWEGLSLSLIEGMVAGRYCITSNIPNNAELVTDGQTGALVSINSPAPLAEAMRAALDNPERTMQLASAARQFGITHHNFDTVADLNEQLYLRLLNNKT